MAAPPLQLDTPPAVPAATGGLLAAATVLPLADRGESGIEYTPDTCARGGFQLLPCVAGEDPTGEILGYDEDWDRPDSKVALPFMVFSGAQCTLTGTTLAELEARARRNLAQSESRDVEAALWTGGITAYSGGAGSSPLMQEPDEIFDPADSLVAAVSALDAYIGATYGFAGMIHAGKGLAAYAARDQLIVADRSGGLLRTPGGNVWVFGGAYTPQDNPPSAPVPPAADARLYATGWITAYRSPVFTIPGTGEAGFDRITNTALLYAARNYVLTWDCVNAVIPVTSL